MFSGPAITDAVRRGSFLYELEQAEARGEDRALARASYELRTAVDAAGYPAWGVTPEGDITFHTNWIGLGPDNAIIEDSYIEGYEHGVGAAVGKWRACLRYIPNELETGTPAPGWICTPTTRQEPAGIWRFDDAGGVTRTAGQVTSVVPPDPVTAPAEAGSEPVAWGTIALVGVPVLLMLALAWRMR